jgi:hypothetical protein
LLLSLPHLLLLSYFLSLSSVYFSYYFMSSCSPSSCWPAQVQAHSLGGIHGFNRLKLDRDSTSTGSQSRRDTWVQPFETRQGQHKEITSLPHAEGNN